MLIETRRGNINVELYADQEPKTVKNFLEYIDQKDRNYYDRTVFHRLIKNDIIQGGRLRKNRGQSTTREKCCWFHEIFARRL